jgi:hypothetical protein
MIRHRPAPGDSIRIAGARKNEKRGRDISRPRRSGCISEDWEIVQNQILSSPDQKPRNWVTRITRTKRSRPGDDGLLGLASRGYPLYGIAPFECDKNENRGRDIARPRRSTCISEDLYIMQTSVRVGSVSV